MVSRFKKKYKQRGRSVKSRDKLRKAKKVGWRRSGITSKSYFENRRNRSDVSKKRRI